MTYASQKYDGILTCDDDPLHILRKPTAFMTSKEWEQAKATIQKLYFVRENILKGGAGLAAPQIGIPYPIFIYTPDRTAEKLEGVINPSFEPLGAIMIERPEACFSVPLRCTKIKRWEKINVKYQTLDGGVVEKVMDGFEAQVFQHELDHLKGQLTIDHETAEVLTFADAQAFEAYMKQIHREDSKRYPQSLNMNSSHS